MWLCQLWPPGDAHRSEINAWEPLGQDQDHREKWTRQVVWGEARTLSEHKGVPDPCYPSWGFSLPPDLIDVETEA